MNFKLTFTLPLSFLMLSCSSVPVQLKPVDEIPPSIIELIDNRSEDDKNGHRGGNASSLFRLRDDLFSTSPTLYLVNDVYEQSPVKNNLVLVVDEYWLADYFPVRSSRAQAAAVGGALAAHGISSTQKYLTGKDSIICAVKGELNGQPFSVSAQSHYTISNFALTVRGQEAWQNAVTDCIKECAKGIFSTPNDQRPSVGSDVITPTD